MLFFRNYVKFMRVFLLLGIGQIAYGTQEHIIEIFNLPGAVNDSFSAENVVLQVNEHREESKKSNFNSLPKEIILLILDEVIQYCGQDLKKSIEAVGSFACLNRLCRQTIKENLPLVIRWPVFTMAFIPSIVNNKDSWTETFLTYRLPGVKADAQDSLALIEAARRGKVRICSLLLGQENNAAQANAQKSLALIEAAKMGDKRFESDSLLNLYGLCSPRCSSDDEYGIVSRNDALCPYLAVCKLLLTPGAKNRYPAHARDQNSEALMVAAKVGSLPLCKLLVTPSLVNIDPARANDQLSLAYCRALRGRHFQICRFLMCGSTDNPYPSQIVLNNDLVVGIQSIVALCVWGAIGYGFYKLGKYESKDNDFDGPAIWVPPAPAPRLMN